MAHDSEPTDLQTDAYLSEQPKAPTKSNEDVRKSQKKTMGISAAALLLGGAAWAITQRTQEALTEIHNSEPGLSVPSDSTIELPREIDVAGKVTDDMSFDQAFAAAREEVGIAGVFGWHGHWYNTFLNEEWSELSVQQRLDFTETVTHEHLPVKPYEQPAINTPESEKQLVFDTDTDPTIIEGHLNGQRVMGLDFNQDGVIDTLVMEGQDGYTYRVVDAAGDDGLDTLLQYDSLRGELVEVEKIEHPFVLSNDNFSQNLEENVPKDVVDSILESDTSTEETPSYMPASDSDVDTEPDDDTIYLTDMDGDDDEMYVNNGDAHDTDE